MFQRYLWRWKSDRSGAHSPIFFDLFNEYQSKVIPEKTNCDDHSSSGLDDSKTCIYFEKMKKRAKKRRKMEQLDQKPELDAYLEEDIIYVDESVADITVLGRWKYANKPILKKMARDILAIPIFSVAPEHIFDTGDYRVSSPHRSRLHPTMVEKLMSTQSWLWTDINDSYSVTNSYSWGTVDNYTVVEQEFAEEAKPTQPH